MNSSRIFLYQKRRLTKLILFSILIFISTVLFLSITTGNVHAGEGSTCNGDFGKACHIWNNCLNYNLCSSSAPYCIVGRCRVQPNAKGGECGEGGDCVRGLKCGDNNTCVGTTCEAEYGPDFKCSTSCQTGYTCHGSNGLCPSDSDSCVRRESTSPAPGSKLPACNVLNNLDPDLKAQCKTSCERADFKADGYSCSGSLECCALNLGSTDNCTPQGENFYCHTSPKNPSDVEYPATFNCGNANFKCYRKAYPVTTGSPTAPTRAPGSSGGSQLTPPGVGYCAGANRETPQAVGGATCGVNNAGFDSVSQYCIQKHGGSLGNFYKCTDPAGGTNTPAPAQKPQGPATGPCALERGGVDTSKGTNGYIDAYCNEKLYNQKDAEAGLFCNATYSDAYHCRDGSIHHFKPQGITACKTSSAWCPANAGLVCKSASGAVQDCKTLGPNYSCTSDYTNSKTSVPTRCSPDGKRWCDSAGTWVSSSQGCGGLYAGIGQVCGDTSQCENAAQGAKCAPFGTSGLNTCQWPGGTGPTPTPGASTKCSEAGKFGAGCPCPAGGGCESGLGCYAEATGNNSTGPFYCTGVGTAWCAKTQSSTTTPATCATSSGYIPPSPTPKNLGYQADCPNINPVSGLPNSCDPRSCQAGYVANRIGPGGTNGDLICQEAVGPGTVCCTKSTATPTTAPTSPAGGGAPGGAATTCANNSVEQCRAGQDGTLTDTCVTGWSNVGKRNCTGNTTCCKVN